jgi:hypothetical protein
MIRVLPAGTRMLRFRTRFCFAPINSSPSRRKTALSPSLTNSVCVPDGHKVLALLRKQHEKPGWTDENCSGDRGPYAAACFPADLSYTPLICSQNTNDYEQAAPSGGRV